MRVLVCVSVMGYLLGQISVVTPVNECYVMSLDIYLCVCVCEQIQQCLDRNNQRQSDGLELQKAFRTQQSEKVRNMIEI